MPNDLNYLKPEPAVEYLPQLFRRIRQGEIKIPAFQRGFEWDEKQIVSLLNSIYNGFPIGSILLWRSESAAMKVEGASNSLFPDVAIKYPVYYVLDGMQRLSTLYAVFHNLDNKAKQGKFNIMFDLRIKQFRYFEEQDSVVHCIYLSTLFSPKDLIRTQSDLSKLADGSELIDATVHLHSTFQEYLIPTITIAGRTLQEVVVIFERVNSTGQKLSSVDFMRAVTWSDQFDLSKEIKAANEKLSELRFEIAEDTMVKLLGLTLGKDPIPEVLLSLREASAADLIEGMGAVLRTLISVAKFFREEFWIYSSDYIPYEGQLMVFFKAFLFEDKLLESDFDEIKSWFWAVGLNEGLRGKPDNYLARVLRATPPRINGSRIVLDHMLKLSPDDFLAKRFIAGRAMSAAFVAMFAARSARSIISGRLIEPHIYMEEFSPGHFIPLLPLSVLRQEFSIPITSARILSNLILVTDEERGHEIQAKVLRFLMDVDEVFFNVKDVEEVLLSQFISSEALNAIRSQKVQAFLEHRSLEMWRFAGDLTGRA